MPNVQAIDVSVEVGRARTSLDGAWRLLMDDAACGISEGWYRGLPAVPEVLDVLVPSIWQEYVDTNGGIGWYEREIWLPEELIGRQLRLRVGAADYYAQVWWNGTRIGEHEGGFTPFEFSLGSAAHAGRNVLIVRVSDVARPLSTRYNGLPGWDRPTSRRVDGFSFAEIPVGHQDWKEGFEFSGIWQSVDLIAYSDVVVEDVFIIPRRSERAVDVRVELSSLLPTDTEVRLEITVTPWGSENRSGAASSQVRFDPGGSVNLRIPIDEPRTWSPDDPFLYEAHVAVYAEGRTLDVLHVRFGLRDFTVGEDGFFYLNDERIFIKGAHYQSTEPRTLAYPKDESMARRIVELAKEGGFNFLRLQLRPTVPAILDAADELGLLCMSEPPLSKMVDNALAGELAVREVSEMVRRDRNRPCIILWNMVNEQAAAMNVVRDMCVTARRLDPTRLITESAGGPSHYYLPHEQQPVSYLTEHYFHGQPVPEALLYYTSNRGTQDQLFFVTEFAHTGVIDSKSILADYPDGSPTGMEDYRGFVRHDEEIQETFDRGAHRTVFPTVPDFLNATLEHQANSIRLAVTSLRSNSRLGGYNIVQLADSNANELSGLVDFWRQRKKPAFEVIRRLNQPFQLLLQAFPFNPLVGGTLDVEVTLVNEAGFDRDCRFHLLVEHADGSIAFQSDEPVTTPRWVTRLVNQRVALGPVPGRLKVTAELRVGDELILAASLNYELFDRPILDYAQVSVFDPQGYWPLAQRPFACLQRQYSGSAESPEVVFVPGLTQIWRDRDAHSKLVDLLFDARRGSTVVFLSPPMDGWPSGLRRADIIDAFHPLTVAAALGFHYELSKGAGAMIGDPYAWSAGETESGGLVTHHPFFAGTTDPGLMDWQWSRVIPRQTLSARRLAEADTGRGLSIFRVGAGLVVFSTYELLANLDTDGLANLLLGNLTTYLVERLPTTLGTRTPEDEADLVFLRSQLRDCYRLLDSWPAEV